MRNQDIRGAIKAARLYYFEVAQQLGVHENTFYRLLRSQLTPIQRERIINAINDLKRQKYTELLTS